MIAGFLGGIIAWFALQIVSSVVFPKDDAYQHRLEHLGAERGITRPLKHRVGRW